MTIFKEQDIDGRISESSSTQPDELKNHEGFSGVRVIGFNDPEMLPWLEIRQEFVKHMGWKGDGELDLDTYDLNPLTGQIIMHDDKGNITFGMRLTPIEKINESLSFSMVADSNIPHSFKEKSTNLPSEQLWDFTRLVPNLNLEAEERAKLIPKLFHEGLEYCRNHGDDNPVWVFALDKGTHLWLKRQGVGVNVIGEDLVGEDKHPTIFGYVKPAEIDADSEAPSAYFAKASRGEV